MDLALWYKAGHIIFAIFWMAGLFILPRFYVYHYVCAHGSPEDAVWQEREIRLRKIILTPSIIITWVFGLLTALNMGSFSEGWFHVKLLILIILSAYHGYMIGFGKKLARGERPLNEKKLRLLNEVPGICIIIIVILAVVRPF